MRDEADARRCSTRIFPVGPSYPAGRKRPDHNTPHTQNGISFSSSCGGVSLICPHDESTINFALS